MSLISGCKQFCWAPYISGFMRVHCLIQIGLRKAIVTLKSYIVDLLLLTYTNNFLVQFFFPDIFSPVSRMLRWRTSYFMHKTNSFCFSYTFFPIWKAYMYNTSVLLLKNTSFGIPTLLILSKSFPSKNDWICQYFENICKTNNWLVWGTVIHFFFFLFGNSSQISF